MNEVSSAFTYVLQPHNDFTKLDCLVLVVVFRIVVNLVSSGCKFLSKLSSQSFRKAVPGHKFHNVVYLIR